VLIPRGGQRLETKGQIWVEEGGRSEEMFATFISVARASYQHAATVTDELNPVSEQREGKEEKEEKTHKKQTKKQKQKQNPPPHTPASSEL